MNFFEHQESARRKTRVLLAYYALAVVLIVCAFYLASRAVFAVGVEYAGSERPVRGVIDRPAAFMVLAWDPLWMLLTAGVSLTVIACGTLYRRATLSDGGSSVACSAGGREVLPNTRNFHERRLLNIVEEIALASGVPVPRVFVLEQEQGVNAFAAGFSLNDAAVAVTRGAMERLTRDELQGVVAHEFSHILNGDMRLNSWLIGILFGILVTSVLGRELMRLLGRARVSGSKKSGGGVVLLCFLSGLALWVIGSAGVFFARMIQCSVSREREFLADASAVQFTRNPAGLAGALKRIGASKYMNEMHCANRSELSHLLFASGSASGFAGLFATHPPLLNRIRLLDPAFDGNFASWRQRAAPSCEGDEGAEKDRDESSAFASAADGGSQTGTGEAADFLRGLAPELREAVAQPSDAASVLYALLLSEDDGVRLRQRGRIMALEGQPLAAAAERERVRVRRMDRTARRRVAELAVEGARQRSPASRATCVRLVRELAEADGAISLFEYMLQGRVSRRLYPSSDMSDVRRKPLPPELGRGEAAVVLGTLAYAGQPGADGPAESAWHAGAALAPSFGLGDLLPDRSSCTLDALDRALTRLEGLSPLAKGELIGACSAVVRADGSLTQDETELLRAVADQLDMPLQQM
jgi:Zn-dependent protease with chaperone function/uncharacterized tellurite resistance protein B-like protein